MHLKPALLLSYQMSLKRGRWLADWISGVQLFSSSSLSLCLFWDQTSLAGWCMSLLIQFVDPDWPRLIFDWLSSLCQDWGRPGDLRNLDIQWHVPSAEEKQFVFYLLDLLLKPELQRLQKHMQGEQEISRSATKTCDMWFDIRITFGVVCKIQRYITIEIQK